MSARSGRIGKVENLLNEAEAIVMAEVEKRARAVLRSRNPAKSFCMGMGTASFYDKDGNPIMDEARWNKRFYDLISEYDDVLKLTGNPMKIESADGPVITDW